jgi:hypothetical protein
MAVAPAARLRTPTDRGRFSVARYTTDGLVLLLGDKEAWTPLPWQALEEVPDFSEAEDGSQSPGPARLKAPRERWMLTSRNT